ncbi:MAG: phosphotransferase [Candidatus Krumholzibacteria bacterium]|nr:phosphotransferase [Candidatus Krumholzibacteria bacterium]
MTDPDVLALALRALEGDWERMPGGGFSDKATVSVITGGGSDRHFLRVEEDGLSAVVLVQPGGGAEFDRYVRNGNFLRENGVAVPGFYFVDEGGVVVMEDLGDIHLVDALEDADPPAELAFYRDCINILYRLQTSVTGAEKETGILGDMVFSEEMLLGETDYFAREFVVHYAGRPVPEGWDAERRTLAAELASHPRVFMHRDFQSRNIMVKDGTLRIVDFQTAHRGPGMYDVASLLKDPYHPVESGTRKTLLMELYYRFTGNNPEPEGGFEAFNDRFVLAGIQRNMQALAAFSFLGLEKGKKEFLEFIRPGIGLLEEGLTESGRFPVTSGLVARIRDKIIERND